jgi:hypothetical protein
MTYEPGQQVLVRGVVATADFQLGQGPDHCYLFFSDDSGCRVPAADVVGPAPATPDGTPDRFKGVIAFKVDLADGRTLIVDPADVTIVSVNDDNGPAPATPDEGHVPLGFHLTVVADRNEALAALAAAETERDAYEQESTRRGTRVIELERRLSDAQARIRALSVEAAGPEGGGGHE